MLPICIPLTYTGLEWNEVTDDLARFRQASEMMGEQIEMFEPEENNLSQANH